jgi:hypothetical protein
MDAGLFAEGVDDKKRIPNNNSNHFDHLLEY